MHGKAQREPAWHSVVLDCKLVLLHNTCLSLPAVCYMNCLNGTLHECFFVFKQSIAGRKLYTKYDVFIGNFVSYSAVYYDFNNCVLGN